MMHVKLDVLGDVPFELEVMREAVGHEFFCRRSRARDQLGNQQELKFCNCNAWRISALRSEEIVARKFGWMYSACRRTCDEQLEKLVTRSFRWMYSACRKTRDGGNAALRAEL